MSSEKSSRSSALLFSLFIVIPHWWKHIWCWKCSSWQTNQRSVIRNTLGKTFVKEKKLKLMLFRNQVAYSQQIYQITQQSKIGWINSILGVLKCSHQTRRLVFDILYSSWCLNEFIKHYCKYVNLWTALESYSSMQALSWLFEAIKFDAQSCLKKNK